MVVSADTLRFAICWETSPGVIPATPTWQVVRVTGEGLAYNPTATNSAEMDASRNVRDSILTGGEVSGDINFELSYNTPWMDLLESAFCSDWGDFANMGIPGGTLLNGYGAADTGTRAVGADDIFIGSEQKTFTVEKRFTLDDSSFIYHRYNGCLVNTMTLNVTPNEPINGSFGVVGRGLTLATTQLAGSTYVDPGVNPVFTALNVSDILFDGPSFDMTYSAYCFNGLTFNLNNNARRTACVGPATTAQTVLGRMEASIDANVYLSDNKMLTWLLNQEDVAIRVNMRDTASPVHKYILRAPRAKVQSGTVVASGTGQDVISQATFACLLPGTPTGMTSVSFSRETLP